MKPSTRLPLVLMALSFASLLVGCTQDEPFSAQPSPAQADTFVPFSIPEGKSIGLLLEQATPTEKKALMESYGEAARLQAESETLVMHAASWQEADAALRPLLVAQADHPFAYLFVQVAANRMLARHLLPAASDSPEVLAATGYYTDLLLAWNHPDASVLLPALDRLSTWTSGKRDEARARVVAAAQRYLEKNPCEACLEGSNVQNARDIRQQRPFAMQQAIQ